MSEINVGTVKIVLPAGIEIDARAGKLSDEEKREVPRVRKGIGLACGQTAVEIEKVGTSFSIPGVIVPQFQELPRLIPLNQPLK